MVLNVGRDQPGFKIRILKPGIVTFWKFFGLGWKILEVHLKWMFQWILGYLHGAVPAL